MPQSLGLIAGTVLVISSADVLLPVPAQKLERAGFVVHLFKTADQREAAGETGVNFMSVISEEATGDFAEK